jgi:hypothetical protein
MVPFHIRCPEARHYTYNIVQRTAIAETDEDDDLEHIRERLAKVRS